MEGIATNVVSVRPEDVATCVSCGLCLNDCPTYRILGDEADSPRGRIHLIRQLMTTTAAPDPSVVTHIDACLVCRACETACPSLVPFGRIMEGAREEIAHRRPAGRLRAALIDLVTHPRLLAAAALLAWAYERSGLRRVARRLLPRRLAEMEALLPAAEGAVYRPAPRADADVQLFAGCLMRSSFGDTQRSTVRVLERSGLGVGSPQDQVCCGALHAHAGLGERSRELARANIASFSGSNAPIVVTAAGCGAHLRAYGELLGDEAARRYAARVRDASEVARPPGARRTLPRPARVAYQDACHLAHGQRIRREPRELLRGIDGVELVAIADPDRCCGSAGIYNLTHPEIARELQRQKVETILAARPDVVVSANPGCILQLRAGLAAAGARVPVVHLMRFLDDPSSALGATSSPGRADRGA
ncbi:MAG: 4Fe-4S dicluster domain-containing protein [Chloroflexi bacterium]|nr:4Fe-4S dicluster domain-containing protein [Chloroflexota bacterium]